METHSDAQLEMIVEEMKSSGLIGSRTYRLKKYKRVFVGKEAVTWMVNNLIDVDSRQQATLLGHELCERGFLHHCTYDHTFKDAHLFYRFGSGKEPEDMTSSRDSAKMLLAIANEPSASLLQRVQPLEESTSSPPLQLTKWLSDERLSRSTHLDPLFRQHMRQSLVVDVKHDAEAHFMRLSELQKRLFHPEHGVEVKDRKWRFRKYKQCFVGKEAVTWFVSRFGITRAEAVRIGGDLLREGFINHVVNDRPFADAFFFYKRTEPDEHSVSAVTLQLPMVTLGPPLVNHHVDGDDQHHVRYRCVVNIGLQRLYSVPRRADAMMYWKENMHFQFLRQIPQFTLHVSLYRSIAPRNDGGGTVPSNDAGGGSSFGSGEHLTHSMAASETKAYSNASVRLNRRATLQHSTSSISNQSTTTGTSLSGSSGENPVNGLDRSRDIVDRRRAYPSPPSLDGSGGPDGGKKDENDAREATRDGGDCDDDDASSSTMSVSSPSVLSQRGVQSSNRDDEDGTEAAVQPSLATASDVHSNRSLSSRWECVAHGSVDSEALFFQTRKSHNPSSSSTKSSSTTHDELPPPSPSTHRHLDGAALISHSVANYALPLTLVDGRSATTSGGAWEKHHATRGSLPGFARSTRSALSKGPLGRRASTLASLKLSSSSTAGAAGRSSATTAHNDGEDDGAAQESPTTTTTTTTSSSSRTSPMSPSTSPAQSPRAGSVGKKSHLPAAVVKMNVLAFVRMDVMICQRIAKIWCSRAVLRMLSGVEWTSLPAKTSHTIAAALVGLHAWNNRLAVLSRFALREEIHLRRKKHPEDYTIFLFRDESFCTLLVNAITRMACAPYLQSVLSPLVRELLALEEQSKLEFIAQSRLSPISPPSSPPLSPSPSPSSSSAQCGSPSPSSTREPPSTIGGSRVEGNTTPRSVRFGRVDKVVVQHGTDLQATQSDRKRSSSAMRKKKKTRKKSSRSGASRRRETASSASTSTKDSSTHSSADTSLRSSSTTSSLRSSSASTGGGASEPLRGDVEDSAAIGTEKPTRHTSLSHHSKSHHSRHRIEGKKERMSVKKAKPPGTDLLDSATSSNLGEEESAPASHELKSDARVVEQRALHLRGSGDLPKEVLYTFAVRIVKAIARSVRKVPFIMRYLCRVLHQLGLQLFPEDANRVIASYLFLHMIVPALIQPEEFGLIPPPPPGVFRSRKALLFVGKAVQRLANELSHHNHNNSISTVKEGEEKEVVVEGMKDTTSPATKVKGNNNTKEEVAKGGGEEEEDRMHRFLSETAPLLNHFVESLVDVPPHVREECGSDELINVGQLSKHMQVFASLVADEGSFFREELERSSALKEDQRERLSILVEELREMLNHYQSATPTK